MKIIHYKNIDKNKNTYDKEWIQLIKEAKELGISIQELKNFLRAKY